MRRTNEIFTRKNLYAGILNVENSQELQESIPTIIHGAYAVFCYVRYGRRSHIVTVNDIHFFGTDFDQIYQFALENSRNCTYNVCRIDEVVSTKADVLFYDEQYPPMYQMTTLSSRYGAIGLIIPEILSKATLFVGNIFYILPTSIHELIFIPDTGKNGVTGLSNMLRKLNPITNHPTEILSDTVYHYHYGHITEVI